jgi:hypothetical protein
MLDTFFIALTLIFFALSLWYVGACEKLSEAERMNWEYTISGLIKNMCLACWRLGRRMCGKAAPFQQRGPQFLCGLRPPTWAQPICLKAPVPASPRLAAHRAA